MNLTPVFSVSEINQAINRHLSLIGEVEVRGEIDTLNIKNNRLVFLTLKDDKSAIDIFSLTHQIPIIASLKVGDLVQVSGSFGVYQKNSRFRMHITAITPIGEGGIIKEFEELKHKLMEEGLFDHSRKRPIPQWPERIGLLTAKGSSAFHDIVKIINQRMRGVTITLFPVSVQGIEAVPSMVRALKYCHQHHHEFDVIILARGGGSAQDLAAFNNEKLVRILYGLKVPSISAIGHEDNWTLIDYVADVRASTPSNAAELVVKDGSELTFNIDMQLDHLKSIIFARINAAKSVASQKQRSLALYHNLINQKLNQLIDKHLIIKTILLNQVNKRQRLIHDSITKNRQGISQKIDSALRIVSQYHHRLIASNPENILKRGYAIVKNNQSQIIKYAKSVNPEEVITIRLHQGSICAQVNKIAEAA